MEVQSGQHRELFYRGILQVVCVLCRHAMQALRRAQPPSWIKFLEKPPAAAPSTAPAPAPAASSAADHPVEQLGMCAAVVNIDEPEGEHASTLLEYDVYWYPQHRLAYRASEENHEAALRMYASVDKTCLVGVWQDGFEAVIPELTPDMWQVMQDGDKRSARTRARRRRLATRMGTMMERMTARLTSSITPRARGARMAARRPNRGPSPLSGRSSGAVSSANW